MMGYTFPWIAVTGVLFAIGLHTLPAGGTGCCTDGFHSLRQLISGTGTIYTSRPTQGLHPAFRITCDGNLTEIIYTTTTGGSTGPEYFIVWREISPGSNVYHAVYPTISRRSETLLIRLNTNIDLYTVKVRNFSVFARDFIGFLALVPSTLRFSNINNAASGNIYLSTPSDTIDLTNVTHNNNQRYSPLITVVISPSSVAYSSPQLLSTPDRSITPSTILPRISPVTSPAMYTVAYSTSSSINPTAIFTTTMPSPSESSRMVLNATVAIVSCGVTICLILLLFSLIFFCGACAVKSRNNKKHCKLGQSTEYALSDICPEVVDKVHAKMERRSSDGDNCSMEYNPTYGDPFIDGLKQDKSTNNYHILKFEHKPACKQEQQLQLAINGDSNCYHTLQYLDHMPKCDYESEYCDLADISNYINADGVPKPEERSDSCFVTTLEQATMKSGADMAEIENEYDHLNAGHSCVEHCDVIVLKPNHCYNSVKMKSHV